MIPNRILKNMFDDNSGNSSVKKYKWYMFTNAFHADKNVILNDPFWAVKEKDIISKLIEKPRLKIDKWVIEYRVFRGVHLDVCVICLKF